MKQKNQQKSNILVNIFAILLIIPMLLIANQSCTEILSNVGQSFTGIDCSLESDNEIIQNYLSYSAVQERTQNEKLRAKYNYEKGYVSELYYKKKQSLNLLAEEKKNGYEICMISRDLFEKFNIKQK